MTSDFETDRATNLTAVTGDMAAEDMAAEGTAGDNDEDARVEELEAEIIETRSGLTETVEAIGQKLEPSNLAREAGETARAATIGKVEQMSMGMQETWRDVRSGNGEGILATIKSNPIPAAMIGLGLGMLFMNRGATSQTSSPGNGDWRRGYYGYEPYGGDDSGYDASGGQMSGGQGGGIGSKIGGAREQAGERVGRVTGSAGETMNRMATTVGQTADQIPQQVGQIVDRQGSQLRRVMDENPLGLGVAAVAAGAAVGMLIPTTQLERETVGQQRDQLVGRAESAINDSLESVKQGTSQQGTSQQGSGSTSGGSSSSRRSHGGMEAGTGM
jgi:hypothetical protein